MSERSHKTIVTIAVVGPFLGFLLALVLAWNRYVFWTDMVLFFVIYFFTALGATIGYHRMLTHQGFGTSPMLRALFLILGCMAFAGSRPENWAATHIKHHALSDDEGDPHSPLDGFLHAHFGWLFSLESFVDPREYAPHLLQDSIVMFVSRYTPLWVLLTFLIPFVIGGWTGLLWGGIVRVFFTTHITWSVNSICHTFGRRDFETTDESRNEWIVGLLAFGEGWHNNHHAFPRSAFHGLHWWQFDLSGLIIRALERLGLVWDVQRVGSEAMISRRAVADRSRQILVTLRSELSASIARAKRELMAIARGPFHATLADGSVAELSASCMEALERLEAIQANIARATHLKKQRLAGYSHEVADLVARVKARIPRTVAA